MKSGIGSTGVALRFHTQAEYAKLTAAQKSELHEYRTKQEAEGKGRKLSKSTKSGSKSKSEKSDKDSDKKLQKMISAAITKQITESKTAEDNAAEEEQALRSYVVSVIQSETGSPGLALPPKPATKPVQPPTGVTIQSILKRVNKQNEQSS